MKKSTIGYCIASAHLFAIVAGTEVGSVHDPHSNIDASEKGNRFERGRQLAAAEGATWSQISYLIDRNESDGPVDIVGGTPLAPGEAPYLVALQGGTLCGATLISPRVVLSAAHCFTCRNTAGGCTAIGDFRQRPSRVDLGVYDRINGPINYTFSICDNEFGTGCTNEAFVIRDPDYNTTLGVTGGSDFALIFLPQEINDVEPVALNGDPTIPAQGDELEIIGWGGTGSGTSDVPLSAMLGYVPNDACTAPPYLWQPSDIDATMLCGAADGDESVCGGDSGGPAILNGQNGPLQVGVSSFIGTRGANDACNSTVLPNVFARTSSRIDWIEDTICEIVPTDEVFCATSSTTTATSTSTTASTASATTSTSFASTSATASTSTSTSTSTSASTASATTSTTSSTSSTASAPSSTAASTSSTSTSTTTSTASSPTSTTTSTSSVTSPSTLTTSTSTKKWSAPGWSVPTAKSSKNGPKGSKAKSGKAKSGKAKSGKASGHGQWPGQWPGQWHETADGHSKSNKSSKSNGHYQWGGQWHDQGHGQGPGHW